MPIRRTRRVHRLRHTRQRGRGFMSFLGKANTFLKNSKLVSSIGSALGQAGVPYASDVAGVASSLGYGRRRHGKGLGLAGGSRRRRR